MVAIAIPPGVIERIVEVLEPDEVWLFGSRARQTHGPDSDWDLMALVPDTAPERNLDLASVWSDLRDLRRMRMEVFPIRRRDFEQDRRTLGELAEAVAREGHLVYGRCGAAQTRADCEAASVREGREPRSTVSSDLAAALTEADCLASGFLPRAMISSNGALRDLRDAMEPGGAGQSTMAPSCTTTHGWD